MDTNIPEEKLTIKTEIMEDVETIYVENRESAIRGNECLLDLNKN